MSDKVSRIYEGRPASANEALKRLEKKVEGRGGPPYDSGMEARMQAVELGLKHVESRVSSLETKVDGLDTRLRSVEIKLGEIGGKIDIISSNMSQMLGKLPSWWQMPVIVAGTAALVIAIIKLFAPH